LLTCLLVISTSSYLDRIIGEALSPPPHSISWLVTFVYYAGSFGVIAIIVAIALLDRRWVIARDIGLGALGAAALSGLLIVVLGSDGGRSGGTPIQGFYAHFPVLQIAVFMAVVTAALP